MRENEARLKVAEALESERKRFFDVLETLPFLICLLTTDHHIAFANRSFLKLDKNENIKNYLLTTVETISKASELTKQLLTFSRGGAPVKKDASLVESHISHPLGRLERNFRNRQN